jgi:hypothetical protein
LQSGKRLGVGVAGRHAKRELAGVHCARHLSVPAEISEFPRRLLLPWTVRRFPASSERRSLFFLYCVTGWSALRSPSLSARGNQRVSTEASLALDCVPIPSIQRAKELTLPLCVLSHCAVCAVTKELTLPLLRDLSASLLLTAFVGRHYIDHHAHLTYWLHECLQCLEHYPCSTLTNIVIASLSVSTFATVLTLLSLAALVSNSLVQQA